MSSEGELDEPRSVIRSIGVSRRGQIWVLVGLFVLTRTLVFVAVRPWEEERKYTHFVRWDGEEYYWIAVNLIAGHGYSKAPDEPYVPDAARTPIYPVFLAAILGLSGGAIWTVLAVQIVIQMLTVMLIYGGLARLSSRREAFWLTGYCILDPVYLLTSVLLYTETLYQLVNVPLGYLLIQATRRDFKMVRIGVIGLLFGISILIRPIGLYFVAFILLLMFAHEGHVSRALGKGAVLISCVVIVVMPWMARNASVFGRWGISSVTGAALLEYYARPFTSTQGGRGSGQPEVQPQDNVHIVNPFERSDALKKEALGIIEASPLSYAWFHLRSTWPVFFGASTGALAYLVGWESERRAVGSSEFTLSDAGGQRLGRERDWHSLLIVGVNLLLVLCLYTLFLVGVARLWHRREFLTAVLLMGSIAYYAGITGPNASSRYRLSLIPFLLFGAATGMGFLRDRWHPPDPARESRVGEQRAGVFLSD